MSCPHGNPHTACDICDEIDAAWKAGEASGKRSAEHCTCPACRITHANDCAVHNMPAMPIGECNCGVAGAVKVPDGAALIAIERQRQMSEEGWSSSHDAEHDLGELSLAALCYVAPPIHWTREHTPPLSWPWDESWWKPGDRIRELTKAGALIAAEIDRLAATQEKAS